ncbi:XK-related protein 7 [Amphibalanus amphitrite]|uniref:XK-related protein n=1 Tax=Amphibalanus amphitrite TaxID=1232801 RepID=A0A6A4W4R9_AMPAM|nr:XK-related protein 7 [Amphibalanus amphitrite]
MTVWVVLQRTDLFPNQWEERLFNVIVGGIYCFCFFNVKESPARWRMLAFYSLLFAEDAALAVAFFLYWPRPGEALYTVLLANVAAGTALGTFLLLIYYMHFHPNAAARPTDSAPGWGPPPTTANPAEGAGTGAAHTGTLRSLKGHAAGRVSAVSLRSAGGVSLTSQPGPVTSSEAGGGSPTPAIQPPSDRPFHMASELLAPAAGHVTSRSAVSLPAGRGHVTAGERRNQSATAILQRNNDSAASGRVSDIPQLDSVSEGDVTLQPAAETPPPPSSKLGGPTSQVFRPP